MAVYTCRRCEFESDEPWEETCPGCGGFYRPRKFGVDSMEQKGEHQTMGGKASLSKIHHISTGDEGFDHVLSGGLVAGKVLLLGGFAGVGKTRKLLAIADYIAKTQGKVIYASGEESADDVNMAAASLGLKNDQVIILGNQYWIEPVLELAKKVNAFLVIWDSGQKFASKSASGMPGPASLIETTAFPAPSLRVVMLSLRSGAWVEAIASMALIMRLMSTCCSSTGLPDIAGNAGLRSVSTRIFRITNSE